MYSRGLTLPGTGHIQDFDLVSLAPFPNRMKILYGRQVNNQKRFLVNPGQFNGQGRTALRWSPGQNQGAVRVQDIFFGPDRIASGIWSPAKDNAWESGHPRLAGPWGTTLLSVSPIPGPHRGPPGPRRFVLRR